MASFQAGPSFSLGMGSAAENTDAENSVESETRSACSEEDVKHFYEQIDKGEDAREVEKAKSIFLEEDPEFQRQLAAGGPNPSLPVNKWASRRLQKFREFKGWDTSVAFEDLPPAEMVKVLTKFFEQVCKLDGTLYPSQTIMSLYMAFYRILVKKQEARVMQTGVPEPVFNMKECPLFKPVNNACMLAMARSRNKGANLPRKKAHVISQSEEFIILSHNCTSVSHPRGLQRRVAFMLLTRFGIRGGAELYNLQKIDFSLSCDEGGKHVRYDERQSKNYKVGMQRFQEEHFRPAVNVYEPDVYATFEIFFRHMPQNVHMFTQCIDSHRTMMWFSTLRLSQKKLSGILKECFEECGLDSQFVTNRSGRTSLVTRMAAEGVPARIGMQITGHKTVGAYARYDRSTEAAVKAAHKSARDGTQFQENLMQETKRMKKNVVEGLMEEGDSSVHRIDSHAEHAEALAATELTPAFEPQQVIGGTELQPRGAKIDGTVAELGTGPDPFDSDEFNWVNNFDWDNLGQVWPEGGASMNRVVNVNPIHAFFNQLANCKVAITMSHCTFN